MSAPSSDPSTLGHSTGRSSIYRFFRRLFGPSSAASIAESREEGRRLHVADAARYQLALEEARRGATQQWADLASMRGYALSVLGVAGLAASFLGGLAIRDGTEVSIFTWCAIVAFVAVAVLCVTVLWPRQFITTENPQVIIKRWVDESSADNQTQSRALALFMAEHYDSNARTLNKLMRFYCAAIIALLIQILCLIVDLIGR